MYYVKVNVHLIIVYTAFTLILNLKNILIKSNLTKS